ncbi:MAG: DNA-binding protein [Proteobacteria bacterium]|nr:DNA-binding protein [Pseudomonadota bacterium]
MITENFNLNRAAYTVAELEAILPFRRTRIYGLVKEGKLRPTRCGRRTMFLASDVQAFLVSLRDDQTSGGVQ